MYNVAAMMAIEEGPHTRHVDAEDLHDRDEVDIPALIRKIADAEDKSRGVKVKASGVPTQTLAKHENK